jgi:hypothetical protein
MARGLQMMCSPAMRSPIRTVSCLVLATSLYACTTADPGGGDDGDDDGTQPMLCPTEGRYLALTPGASWRFMVRDADTNEVTEKTQTVGALENVGGSKEGMMAFRVTTTKPNGSTTSWQQDTGDSIRRHKEIDAAGTTQTTEIYDPYRTRVDETSARLVAGATWTESYTEIVTTSTGATTTTPKTEQWTVEALEEQVTVPAGTFCAMRVHRTSTVAGGSGSDKMFWFTRGVGKIKEVGAGQTEELMSR